MRTTLDLPDEVFKHAKLAAVHEGLPLKTIIARALRRGLDSPAFESENSVKECAPLLRGKAHEPVSEAWKSVLPILEEGWAAQISTQPISYRSPNKQRILEAIRAHKQRRR